MSNQYTGKHKRVQQTIASSPAALDSNHSPKDMCLKSAVRIKRWPLFTKDAFMFVSRSAQAQALQLSQAFLQQNLQAQALQLHQASLQQNLQALQLLATLRQQNLQAL